MASIEKLDSGKYRAVVSTTKNGKRQKIYSTIFAKRKDAVNAGLLLDAEKIQGNNLVASTLSFYDYYQRWYKNYKMNSVRESTQRKYHQYAERINKYFDGMQLQDLTTANLQVNLDEFAKTHKHTTTLDFLTTIKASLRDAKIDKYITDDVYSRLKANGLPTIKKQKAFNVGEFEKLQTYLYANLDKEFNRLALLALGTGARLGELLALKWSDVSIAFKTINIDKSYSTNVRKVTATKNTSSERVISIDKDLADALKPYKGENDEFLFNFPQNSMVISKHTSDLYKAVGIPSLTFHSLRHTHASFLLYHGIDINYVSKRLGHASTMVTQSTYAHMLKEKEQSQNEIALNLLSKSQIVPRRASER